MPYTTASIVDAPTLTKGVLRVLWEIAGDKVDPQRFAEEFTSAPDLSQVAQHHLSRLNGMVTVAATAAGPVSLPTPPHAPDPPTQDQLDRVVFIQAASNVRAAQKSFDSAKQALDATLITSVDAASQALTEAQAAMKAAYREGFELLIGIV